MKKLVGIIVVGLWMLVASASSAWAQCAMCRGSVESTMGNGRNNVGIGLNVGIVYLFLIPYLTLAVVAYFWYRNSKRELARRNLALAGLSDSGGRL